MDYAAVGGSQASLPTTTSSVYDGYETAQRPEEYMAAPPIMMGSLGQEVPELTGAAGESARACAHYRVISEMEVQSIVNEINSLSPKIQETQGQLDVERKMVEAATSLSKLHMSTPKRESRMSRVFSGDKSKRLSRQAEEEVEQSVVKIQRLEGELAEMKDHKHTLELKLLEHHAAVLSQALIHGVIPAQRQKSSQSLSHADSQEDEFSNDSHSDFSLSNYPAAAAALSVNPRHARQESQSTVKGHSRGESQATARGIPVGFSQDTEAELSELATRLANALPTTTPQPNKLTFITSSFDALLNELKDRERQLEGASDQLQAADARLEHLKSELDRREQQPESARALKASHEAEVAEARTALATERARTTELRARSDAQRKELERVVASLEDVTQLAVGYESQRAGYASVVADLERRLQDLRSKEIDARASRFASTSSGSILSREFRDILHELQQEHWKTEHKLRGELLGVGSNQNRRESVAIATTKATEARASLANVHQPRVSAIDNNQNNGVSFSSSTAGPSRHTRTPSSASSEVPSEPKTNGTDNSFRLHQNQNHRQSSENGKLDAPVNGTSYAQIQSTHNHKAYPQPQSATKGELAGQGLKVQGRHGRNESLMSSRTGTTFKSALTHGPSDSVSENNRMSHASFGSQTPNRLSVADERSARYSRYEANSVDSGFSAPSPYIATSPHPASPYQGQSPRRPEPDSPLRHRARRYSGAYGDELL